jgi:tetratricopeptide (TPR) repeat protein
MLSERENNMKNGNALLLFKLSLISIFMLMLSLFSACSKGEEPKEKASDYTVNPYSSDSVFDEVQRELQKNPNDADALYHLADLYDRDAQYKEAIETYKKVLQLKPKSGYIYFKIGTAYDRLNQPSEAVAALQSAVKYMPSYAVAYNNLGIAYGKLNKPEDEIRELKKALKIRPRYSSARYNLGMTYLRIGNKKGALDEYKALKEYDEGAAESLMKEIGKAS